MTDKNKQDDTTADPNRRQGGESGRQSRQPYRGDSGQSRPGTTNQGQPGQRQPGTTNQGQPGQRKQGTPGQGPPGQPQQRRGPPPQQRRPPQGHQQRKDPGIAAVLSLLINGAGQIYNGQIAKGIAIIILQFINGLLVFLLIGFLTFPAVYIYSVYDAYKTAERINRGGVVP